jgi:hypothetical protein
MLANLADGLGANQEKLHNLEAVQALIKSLSALVAGKGAPEAVEIEAVVFACMALEKMTHYQASRATFLAYKGPATLAAVMAKFPSVLAIQDYCCGVLAAVSQGSSNTKQAEEVGLLRSSNAEDLLRKAMQNHPADYSLHAKVRRAI